MDSIRWACQQSSPDMESDMTTRRRCSSAWAFAIRTTSCGDRNRSKFVFTKLALTPGVRPQRGKRALNRPTQPLSSLSSQRSSDHATRSVPLRGVSNQQNRLVVKLNAVPSYALLQGLANYV